MSYFCTDRILCPRFTREYLRVYACGFKKQYLAISRQARATFSYTLFTGNVLKGLRGRKILFNVTRRIIFWREFSCSLNVTRVEGDSLHVGWNKMMHWIHYWPKIYLVKFKNFKKKYNIA